MYDPRNVLKQKPETIRDLFLTVLALLVALNVPPFTDISAEATGLIGLVIYKLLGVFYVEPQKKANIENDLSKLQDVIDTTAREAPAVIVEDAEEVKVDGEAAPPPEPARRRPRRVEK
jgi:hypothetical protein